MNTFEHEPIAGLPERPPEGEHILWRGKPSWKNLARYTFRTRLVAGYFAFFVVLRAIVAYGEGKAAHEALLSGAALVPVGAVGLGVLLLSAWAHARTTIYTITNKRVVIRYGIALRMIVNLPFKAFLSAEFKRRPGGEGDIPMKLGGGIGPGYAHLWPHVRPWRISRPEPMLRGIPDVESVAKTLAEALIAYRTGETAPDRADAPSEEAEAAASAPASAPSPVAGAPKAPARPAPAVPAIAE
jgi:hypothetical protein